jgi:hypothetical protein
LRGGGFFQPWGSERKIWTQSAPNVLAVFSGCFGETCAPAMARGIPGNPTKGEEETE